MAFVCPECHTEKPWTSPRCPNCNQEVGIFYGLIWNLLAGMLTLALFFLVLRWMWLGVEWLASFQQP